MISFKAFFYQAFERFIENNILLFQLEAPRKSEKDNSIHFRSSALCILYPTNIHVTVGQVKTDFFKKGPRSKLVNFAQLLHEIIKIF